MTAERSRFWLLVVVFVSLVFAGRSFGQSTAAAEPAPGVERAASSDGQRGGPVPALVVLGALAVSALAVSFAVLLRRPARIALPPGSPTEEWEALGCRVIASPPSAPSKEREERETPGIRAQKGR